MHITVNGTEVGIPPGMTVLEYLEQERYGLLRIAVEKNGAIVPKAAYGGTTLEQGDKLEIVSFVGGG